MSVFICVTCAAQYEGQETPSCCRICDDDRQYVGENGSGIQEWTTAGAVEDSGHRNSITQVREGLHVIGLEPPLGIGQVAHLITRPDGNILWDCLYLSQASVPDIQALGGVSSVVISHPHFYTAAASWAQTFGCKVCCWRGAQRCGVHLGTDLTDADREGSHTRHQTVRLPNLRGGHVPSRRSTLSLSRHACSTGVRACRRCGVGDAALPQPAAMDGGQDGSGSRAHCVPSGWPLPGVKRPPVGRAGACARGGAVHRYRSDSMSPAPGSSMRGPMQTRLGWGPGDPSLRLGLRSNHVSTGPQLPPCAQLEFTCPPLPPPGRRHHHAHSPGGHLHVLIPQHAAAAGRGGPTHAGHCRGPPL
uniref:Metallo-beta-lactamase domain-containing protein n=1 Tax=Auxenochlorella protothecoides TaxID=3075 RepID=A0A1D2AFU4_AUXPR